MAIESNADVAARVRAIAAQTRTTQQQLASVLNLSEMAISRRVNGVTPLTPEELIRLSRHFGIPAGYFFGEVAA
jgi:transcriptional regulator with XRE-family HTH domain